MNTLSKLVYSLRMEYLRLAFEYFSHLTIVLVKVAYPAYASFKAIKTPDGADDTTWLIYWTVMAICSFIEIYIIPFIAFVPFFMLVRVGFYIWLQLPVCNGSIYIFKKFLLPFMSKHSKFFEDVTIENKDDLLDTVRRIKEKLRNDYNEIRASLD